MAQMNVMEKRNLINSTQNGGKMAEMRNNSAKSGMVGMSAFVFFLAHIIYGPVSFSVDEIMSMPSESHFNKLFHVAIK